MPNRLLFKKEFIIGISFVLLYILPYVLLGEDAYITIHDFLDSNVAHYHSIKQLDLYGGVEGMLPIMEGIPSSNYTPAIPLSAKSLFFLLFPTYWAIVILTIFVKLNAFWGMYLFCHSYIIKQNKLVSAAFAIIFAAIPFYIDYNLSSAGIPLLLYSILNIHYKRKIRLSLLIIIYFAINSSLVLVGYAIIILWTLFIIVMWYRNKLLPKYHLLGLLFLGMIYSVNMYSTIYNYFFSSSFISHRAEFADNPTVKEIIYSTYDIIIHSHYHAGSLWAIPLLIISLTLIAYNWKKEKIVRICFCSFILIVLLCFIGKIMKLTPFEIFRLFQFDRFYFLYPFLCILLLICATKYLLNTEKKSFLFFLIVLSFLCTCTCDKELFKNYKQLIFKKHLSDPTYSQLFDEDLFSIIKKDIHSTRPFSCKVVSLGIYPSVAEYNLFHTLDSYVQNYPLAYKHKFRKVIEKELEKDEALKEYFDHWGSRCYVFSSELYKNNNQYLCGKNDDVSVEQLDIDTEALKELGCQYIISAVDIKNHNELKLKLVGNYTTEKSFWYIRLYQLI